MIELVLKTKVKGLSQLYQGRKLLLLYRTRFLYSTTCMPMHMSQPILTNNAGLAILFCTGRPDSGNLELCLDPLRLKYCQCMPKTKTKVSIQVEMSFQV